MAETKFGFFIELKNNISALEGATLAKGNPGVGGTHYLFLLTVKYLNQIRGDGYAILLTDTNGEHIDKNITSVYAKNFSEAVHYCENNGINNIVINANIVDRLSLRELEVNVDVILWAHNTLSKKRQQIATKSKSIKWVVCVSESQYKNMCDTSCFSKCTYINNIIPGQFFDEATVSNGMENKVVYIGSVMPQKGVHNLLDIWRYVEKKSPETHLYIFGGANVWNKNMVLSKDGVADPYYNKVINKRLDKLIHPENVHFMGAKGWEYIDSYISSFKVGIVNPSYYMRDETFCLSAIELEAHGIPVVSRKRNDGLSTTVIHGRTGFLEASDEEISERIIQILSDRVLFDNLAKAARKHVANFVAEKVVDKWDELNRGMSGNETISVFHCFTKDTRMLVHDFWLKILFLVESGKWITLILQKLEKIRNRVLKHTKESSVS